MAKPIIRPARKIAAIIAATLLAVVLTFLCAVLLMEQSYRLQSRTVSERQFSVRAAWWEHDLTTIRKFERRHGLNPESHNGLRLAIDEWPDWRYLLSIDGSTNGTATGAIYAIAYDGKRPVYEQDFVLERGEAWLFFASFDRQIDGYWGTTTQCLDGTSFQFERWSDGRVSSGSGNAACQRHYSELMSLLAETLVVHLNDVPFDWRSWLSAKRQLILRGDGSSPPSSQGS